MAAEGTNGLLAQLRGLVLAGSDSERPDPELLARFVADRDEAAFAALVHRHGGLVWGVCRRLLRGVADAEDAFQATFLVLARKAGSIRDRASVGSWLHGVACRVARKLRADLRRREKRPPISAPNSGEDPQANVTWREVRTILDEELDRLPEKYRAPLLLCYLEGLTQDEAARRLGWRPGVLRGRLDRGRLRLRAQLVRRGVVLSAALFGAVLGPPARAAPAVLTGVVVKAASERAAFSPSIVALAEGVLRAMLLTQVKTVTAVTLVVCLGGLLAVLLSAPLVAQDTKAPAGTTPAQPATTSAPPARDTVSDLERRVAELEKKVLRLTNEVDDLRGQAKPKEPASLYGVQPKAKDPELPEGQTKVFPLKHIRAVEAARTLNEVNRGSDKRLTIVADDKTNSLIVQANLLDMIWLGNLIAHMDQSPAKPPAADGPVFKVIPVTTIDPETAVRVLEKVFQGTKVRVISVAHGIAVYGTPDEVAEVAAIVAKLMAVSPKP